MTSKYQTTKHEFSLVYAARIVPDQNGFVVSFRDLINVFSEGDTFEETIFNAQEVLDLLLLEMVQDGLEIHAPSPPQTEEVLIAVSPDIAASVLLHKLRESKHYSMADVARAMGVKYQSYQQIEAGKNITLKSLKRAAAALGATVEIRFHAPSVSTCER